MITADWAGIVTAVPPIVSSKSRSATLIVRMGIGFSAWRAASGSQSAIASRARNCHMPISTVAEPSSKKQPVQRMNVFTGSTFDSLFELPVGSE